RPLRGSQRGAVGRPPLDPDRAERVEEPPPEPAGEELLLGDEADAPPRDEGREGDVEDRPVRRRDDVGPPPRHAFPADHAHAEHDLADADEQVAAHAVEAHRHTAVARSRISSMTTLASWPVVSITMASGAA